MQKLHIILSTIILLVSAMLVSMPAYAKKCDKCTDCKPTQKLIAAHHEEGEYKIVHKHKNSLYESFLRLKDWTVSSYFNYKPGDDLPVYKAGKYKQEDRPVIKEQSDYGTFLINLMRMAEQMTIVAFDQMRMIGQFFDAKHQLDTQKNLQKLQFEANKTYQPSESFCAFGTNVRSMADSESRARLVQAALAKISSARQLGNAGSSAAQDGQDMRSRLEKFRTTYCDPHDNNWRTPGKSGLDFVDKRSLFCQSEDSSPEKAERINRDIDFTRLVDNTRTLNIDFSEDAKEKTADEEDVIALAHNLYGHRPLTRSVKGQKLADSGAGQFYLLLRTIAARRAVAQESYNAIVGMKAQSEGEEEAKTAEFLAAVFRDTGFDEEFQDGKDIWEYMGEKPSYYAQLEALSKKLYQNPDFFVNLYDKPENVNRKRAAMNAIELMVDRAIFESELRQEMILSVLLASYGYDEYRAIQRQIPSPVEPFWRLRDK